MTWSPALVWTRGHDVVQGSADEIVAAMIDFGARVVRDVVIDSAGQGALAAQPGDFWFHTDGVFLTVPPRWVVVEVIRADSGGALHVLDGTQLSEVSQLGGYIWFGNDNGGVHAQIVSRIAGRPCLRYRADYMRDDQRGLTVNAAHASIAALAAINAVALGELPAGSCLVVDNWRVLHRREAFQGARTIRRLWLHGDAEI